jgi:hypothetical protein
MQLPIARVCEDLVDPAAEHHVAAQGQEDGVTAHLRTVAPGPATSLTCINPVRCAAR